MVNFKLELLKQNQQAQQANNNNQENKDNGFLTLSQRTEKGLASQNIFGGDLKTGSAKAAEGVNIFGAQEGQGANQAQGLFGQTQEVSCDSYFGENANGEATFDQGAFYDDALGLSFGNSGATNPLKTGNTKSGGTASGSGTTGAPADGTGTEQRQDNTTTASATYAPEGAGALMDSMNGIGTLDSIGGIQAGRGSSSGSGAQGSGESGDSEEEPGFMANLGTQAANAVVSGVAGKAVEALTKPITDRVESAVNTGLEKLGWKGTPRTQGTGTNAPAAQTPGTPSTPSTSSARSASSVDIPSEVKDNQSVKDAQGVCAKAETDATQKKGLVDDAQASVQNQESVVDAKQKEFDRLSKNNKAAQQADADVKRHQADVDKYTQESAKQDAIIKDQGAKEAQYGQEVTQLTGQITSKKSEIGVTKAEISNLEAQAATADDKNRASVQSQITQAKNRLAQQERELQELETKKENAQKSKDAATEAKKQATDAKTAADRSLEASKKNLEEANKRLQEAVNGDPKLKAAQQELTAERNKLTGLKSKLGTAEGNYSSALNTQNQEVSNLENTVKSAKDTHDTQAKSKDEKGDYKSITNIEPDKEKWNKVIDPMKNLTLSAVDRMQLQQKYPTQMLTGQGFTNEQIDSLGKIDINGGQIDLRKKQEVEE